MKKGLNLLPSPLEACLSVGRRRGWGGNGGFNSKWLMVNDQLSKSILKIIHANFTMNILYGSLFFRKWMAP
jgi:hypothetical protein